MKGRRTFLTHLPFGFALAMTTDERGLTAGGVEIPTSQGRRMPAYRAVPSKGKNYPVVLVVGESMGAHTDIQDVCRRLGKYGYMAIAPGLFSREGDPAAIPDEQAMADLDAALEWAEKHKGDTRKAAVTGFGWGGRIAWLYAAHQPKVKAAVAWNAVLARPLQPKYPADIAASLRVPVLWLYGEKDSGIPLDTVEQIRAALRKGSSGSDIAVYPDAQAAEGAWERMLVWFKKYGVA